MIALVDTMQLVDWQCAPTIPGALDHPSQIDALDWVAAPAPTTAIAAWLAAGKIHDPRDITADDHDWWFRCTFDEPQPDVPLDVVFEGLATLADVWCNGQLVATSDNMFRTLRFPVRDHLRPNGNELVVRCRALSPELARKRPRPRWKANFVDHQNLRWMRTSLMGRMPSWAMPSAPVGIWRPAFLQPRAVVELLDRRVSATIDKSGLGTFSFKGTVRASNLIESAVLEVANVRSPLRASAGKVDGTFDVAGDITALNVASWWPATHGDQPLYAASISCQVAGTDTPIVIELPRVGFRNLTFDHGDTQLWTCNGVPVFMRGVWWITPDPVGLAPTTDQLRTALTQWRDAGVNMLSIPASGSYETPVFFDLCDELGILVWQQLMFTRLDYPSEDPQWAESAIAEVTEQARTLSGHPSVALVCGGFEIEQQRAMLGLDASAGATSFFAGPVAEVIRATLPDVTFLIDTPHGGMHPFTVNEGTATYYGIGAYRRPLHDARHSGLRFASGCLAMAHIGTHDAVDRFIEGGAAIHSATWKRSVPRDHGGAWDMEDTRDRYVATIFGLDPMALRRTDPDRYLDVGRATTSLLVQSAMSEWRRPTSRCNGALILHGRDYVPGTGCGLVDVTGIAKPTYYALKRAAASVAISMSDEGLSGLDVWIHNDTPHEISGTLDASAFGSNHVLTHGQVNCSVPANGTLRVAAERVLGGFHDITYAYQFGAPHIIGVTATFSTETQALGHCVHILDQSSSLTQSDLGLRAVARPTGRVEGEYDVTINSTRFARFVQLSGRAITWSDQGFDLAPNANVHVLAHTTGSFRGRVRALNGMHSMAIERTDA